MTKIDWKGIRERFAKENDEIQKRRSDRDEERAEMLRKLAKERKKEGRPLVLTESFGRSYNRSIVSGQPRSRIFSQKMSIPRERRGY